MDKISLFSTIFLGIFIEAAPFLLLGTLASWLVDEFVDQKTMQRWMPRNRFLGVLTGSMMGLFFPVCECGVVPLVRRLFRKGMPVSAGIAFLLAAPVLNPVVIFSTASAFGVGKVLFLRIGMTLTIAIITGLVFSSADNTWEILRPTAWSANPHAHQGDGQGAARKFWPAVTNIFSAAMDEFFEMGKFLVIGATIAAAMQTFFPQALLLNLAEGPLLSTAVMMALAILLSICSTVDSFVALGFVNTFPLGAILAFLVFGPMVDIKSSLMFWRVFRWRSFLYLILLPMVLALLAGTLTNFLTG